MKLLLPPTIVKRLRREVRGRLHEIGGVLVGEHVATGVFRVVDMSVQVRGGTVAHFVRDPQHHKAFLADFFLPHRPQLSKVQLHRRMALPSGV
jgi:[CysO sulfur-carrier protein]-S-L-cysteine hydrolase